MAADIKDVVQKCQICLEHRNANIREPLQPSKIPDAAWEKAAADIFYLNGRDYYSGYFEVSIFNDAKSITIINKLKSFFSRHGIVPTLKSDNSTQFTSQEFQKFAMDGISGMKLQALCIQKARSCRKNRTNSEISIYKGQTRRE